MASPADLSPRAQRIYAEAAALVTATPANQAALVRYARLRDAAMACWETAERDGFMASTDRGGDRAHPLLEVAMRAERQAMDVGQALGIEPVKKPGQPGRPRGSVSAPDRASAPPRLRLAK